MLLSRTAWPIHSNFNLVCFGLAPSNARIVRLESLESAGNDSNARFIVQILFGISHMVFKGRVKRCNLLNSAAFKIDRSCPIG